MQPLIIKPVRPASPSVRHVCHLSQRIIIVSDRIAVAIYGLNEITLVVTIVLNCLLYCRPECVRLSLYGTATAIAVARDRPVGVRSRNHAP